MAVIQLPGNPHSTFAVTSDGPERSERRHLLPPSDGARYRQLTLALGGDGDLTLTAHEMGASLEAAWGGDDNETTLRLERDAVARLAFVLLSERLKGRQDGLEHLA